MSNHTPGPWHTNDTMSFYVFAHGSLADRAMGKTLPYICNATTQADARLIAAAPELLGALQEIISQIDQGGSGGKVFSRDYCIAQARAAISKAIG